MPDNELSTRLRAVETRVERHDVQIEGLAMDMQVLRAGMATREVVETSITALASQLSAAENSLARDLDVQKRELSRDINALKQRFENDVTPIKKGISRIVWLIILAIVGVLVTMAINGAPKLP